MEPSDDEIVHILRCIIVTAPNARLTTVEGLGRAMFTQYDVARAWPVKRGGKIINASTICSVIKGKQKIPDYQLLHRGLLIEAAVALKYKTEDAPALMAAIRTPQSSLKECVNAAFFFGTDTDVPLRPLIASPLSLPAYWEGRDDDTPAPPAKLLAERVRTALRDDAERIFYIHGAPFSAKREILKSVVRGLEDGFLVRSDRKRMPALALAAEAVSTKVFVDRVFQFFAANIPAADTLRESLDTDGKIAFIRASAKATPVLFIVADIEPFDADAMIRRLRGDRIGDVLQAVIEGHPDTRVVIAGGENVHPPNGESLPTAFWRTAAVPIQVHASPDEYLRALQILGPTLTKRFARHVSAELASPDTPGANDFLLDALTMRLAIGIFEQSKPGKLAVEAGRLSAALRNNSAQDVFDCAWEALLTPMDRLAFGLIAASHDGLRCSTFVRLLTAMRALDSTTAMHDAIDAFDCSPAALTAWARRHGSFVRVRDDDAEDPSVYFRDQIRRLVLKTWMREDANQARDGFWCIAREALDQAHQHQFSGGGDAEDTAFGRYLQALHALLSSIDPAGLAHAPPSAAPGPAFAILPPLDSPATQRPCPRTSYQYAWAELYCHELRGGGRAIDERYGGPATQLAALLVFLTPDKPWAAFETSDTWFSEPLYPQGMPVAAIVLRPPHQLALLTEIAVAALRAQRFALLLNILKLAEGLPRDTLQRADWVRLQRIRLTLSLLHCGDPAIKARTLRRSEEKLPDEVKRYKLEWAESLAQSLLNDLSGRDDVDSIIARGKLNMRIGEIRHWLGRRGGAGLAYMEGYRAERALGGDGGIDALKVTPGRGIRTAVRYLLSRSPTPYEVLEFEDKLAWPALGATHDDATLRLVRSFAEINKRRARGGAVRDRLLAKLDDARILLHTGKYSAACAAVAIAEKLAEQGGAAFETVLELDELRLAVLIEQAMRDTHAQIMDAERATQMRLAIETALQHLRKLAHTPLAECILLSAETNAYIAFSRLFAPVSPESRQHLVNAHERLLEAIDATNEHGVLLLAPRLALMKTGLESILD